MLGMLREESEDGTRPPTHGLDDLADLVQDVRAAGIEVDLVRTGAGEEVDAAVSLAAYRIIQESLTNVIKHSSAASAAVNVHVNDKRLDIEVADPGPRRAALGTNGSGHGLVGLQERARPVGGVVEYGAQGEGFGVHAILPTGAGR